MCQKRAHESSPTITTSTNSPIKVKTPYLFLILSSFAALTAEQAASQADPATQSAPTAIPAPPPAAPAKRGMAELEKLVAPFALYPDQVIATLLPASVYPLEIVQAARFVANTNNLAKLDEQPWDDSVKAVARIPQVIKMMNDDLDWTMALGEAFLAQDKDVMDAIQSMRAKAQQAGTLKTSEQQIVTVTNLVVETKIEQQVVVVTNTVVQIQPANPQVVYVPTYNPTVVYAPPPAYAVNPYPLLTFGAGVAVGAIIANNCDWYHGGCYHGSYHGGGGIHVDGDVNINRGNVNTGNINTGNIGSGNRATQQKWQPNQSRLSSSGSPNANATAASRGWGSGGATGAAARPSTGVTGSGARPSTGAVAPGNRPTASPATGPANTAAARPSTGSAARPTTAPTARPSSSPSVSRAPSGGGSAFSGVNNSRSASRSSSSRGATSRSGGFSGGGGGRGGGRR